jgi:hypothetical protein
MLGPSSVRGALVHAATFVKNRSHNALLKSRLDLLTSLNN